MAFGRRETGMVAHSENKGEIVSALESQQHIVSLSWTSEGPKGKQDLATAKNL
jgi:hypothetical protein